MVASLSVLLFLSAGTLRFWEAWIFITILALPVTVFTVHLARHNPALLDRRLRWREVEPAQRRIAAVSSVVLLAALATPGLDARFGLSSTPVWLVLLADALVLLGYLLFVRTLLANEFASRVVEVEPHQRVVTAGPYSVVRHPMYVAVLLMFGCAPLALGSYWALIPVAFLPPLLVARILNEEAVLRRALDGYADYCTRVRYRLIPGVW